MLGQGTSVGREPGISVRLPGVVASAPCLAYDEAFRLATQTHSFIAITTERRVKLWGGWRGPTGVATAMAVS